MLFLRHFCCTGTVSGIGRKEHPLLDHIRGAVSTGIKTGNPKMVLLRR